MFCRYAEVCRNIVVIRGRCQVIYGNWMAAVRKLLSFAAANVALFLEFIDLCCRYLLTRLVCRINGLQLTTAAVCFWEQELWTQIESLQAMCAAKRNLPEAPVNITNIGVQCHWTPRAVVFVAWFGWKLSLGPIWSSGQLLEFTKSFRVSVLHVNF